MGEKFTKIKDENKILIMLAFFSISKGLWENFKQLWLQDNNLNVTQISQILSLAVLCCVIALIVFSKKLSLDRIKRVLSFSILMKAVCLSGLFISNHTGNMNIINALVILDTIFEKIIIISTYPFIVTIKKDDKLYSKRKLVEYLFSDIGILIGGVSIGRTLLNIVIDYNMCLLISIIFLLLAFVTILNIKKQTVQSKPIELKEVIKYILKNNKIVRAYVIVYLIGNIAMNTGLGLKMLMLTNILGFSDGNATKYLLIVGLLADLIGIIVLKYFTGKNDYISITIKFGIRFLLYTLAFITNNVIMCFVAITWSILISTAYENITDAPYINRVKNDYQMIFTNIIYIVGLIGTAIGLYLAGITYNMGIRYMLGLSAFVMIFQISLCYYLIYLRENDSKMKYVGSKEPNIEYRKRPGAYAIITRKEDNKIGIVTDGDFFYLGGGIEEGETELEALKRELIEESGYTLKNISKFDDISSFIYAEAKGYIEVNAHVYLAEFDEKVAEPIEKDHIVLWVNPQDYVGKMCREWQEYILKEYIEKF